MRTRSCAEPWFSGQIFPYSIVRHALGYLTLLDMGLMTSESTSQRTDSLWSVFHNTVAVRMLIMKIENYVHGIEYIVFPSKD